jgi:hypothetical protein
MNRGKPLAGGDIRKLDSSRVQLFTLDAHGLSHVIVHNLRVPHRAFTPFEAYPPLIVDPDAVLALPIPAKGFETIARWNPEIFEPLGRIGMPQPTAINVAKTAPAGENLGLPAPRPYAGSNGSASR